MGSHRFKAFPATMRSLEKTIHAHLNGIIEKEENGRRLSRDEWTKAVKQAVTEIGHKARWAVTTHGVRESDDPQWLLDLVWAKEWAPAGEKKRAFLKRIGLGMECEWNRSDEELDWDFQKLLVVRADLRLFVFDQKQRDDVDRIIERCKMQIEGFDQTQPGDRYLFVASWTDCEKFKATAVVARIA